VRARRPRARSPRCGTAWECRFPQPPISRDPLPSRPPLPFLSLPCFFSLANQSRSAPLLITVVAHGVGASQALARPRVSSSPLLRVVLHLPQGKLTSDCFSCSFFPTPVNQGEARSPSSPLYSNPRHPKSSFPNLGEVLRWFAHPLSPPLEVSPLIPMEAYLH
jgi:hypothetical protein